MSLSFLDPRKVAILEQGLDPTQDVTSLKVDEEEKADYSGDVISADMGKNAPGVSDPMTAGDTEDQSYDPILDTAKKFGDTEPETRPDGYDPILETAIKHGDLPERYAGPYEGIEQEEEKPKTSEDIIAAMIASDPVFNPKMGEPPAPVQKKMKHTLEKPEIDPLSGMPVDADAQLAYDKETEEILQNKYGTFLSPVSNIPTGIAAIFGGENAEERIGGLGMIAEEFPFWLSFERGLTALSPVAKAAGQKVLKFIDSRTPYHLQAPDVGASYTKVMEEFRAARPPMDVTEKAGLRLQSNVTSRVEELATKKAEELSHDDRAFLDNMLRHGEATLTARDPLLQGLSDGEVMSYFNKMPGQTITSGDSASLWLRDNGLIPEYWDQLMATSWETYNRNKFNKVNKRLLKTLVNDERFKNLNIFDQIRVYAAAQRPPRQKIYPKQLSISQNAKAVGSDIYTIDTIRGCDNFCLDCYAIFGAAQQRIEHAQPVKAILTGKFKPDKTYRFGTVGDPAYDWVHSADQISQAIQRSKGFDPEKNLFVITKLQNIDGFDPRLFRNLEVSLDPLFPDHMMTAMQNVVRLKRQDPSLNIYLRIRSFESLNKQLDNSLNAAVQFAKDTGLPVLETRMRWKSGGGKEAGSFELVQADPSKYKRGGPQMKLKESALKKRLDPGQLDQCNKLDILENACLKCGRCRNFVENRIGQGPLKADPFPEKPGVTLGMNYPLNPKGEIWAGSTYKKWLETPDKTPPGLFIEPTTGQPMYRLSDEGTRLKINPDDFPGQTLQMHFEQNGRPMTITANWGKGHESRTFYTLPLSDFITSPGIEKELPEYWKSLRIAFDPRYKEGAYAINLGHGGIIVINRGTWNEAGLSKVDAMRQALMHEIQHPILEAHGISGAWGSSSEKAFRQRVKDIGGEVERLLKKKERTPEEKQALLDMRRELEELLRIHDEGPQAVHRSIAGEVLANDPMVNMDLPQEALEKVSPFAQAPGRIIIGDQGKGKVVSHQLTGKQAEGDIKKFPESVFYKGGSQQWFQVGRTDGMALYERTTYGGTTKGTKQWAVDFGDGKLVTFADRPTPKTLREREYPVPKEDSGTWVKTRNADGEMLSTKYSAKWSEESAGGTTWYRITHNGLDIEVRDGGKGLNATIDYVITKNGEPVYNSKQFPRFEGGRVGDIKKEAIQKAQQISTGEGGEVLGGGFGALQGLWERMFGKGSKAPKDPVVAVSKAADKERMGPQDFAEVTSHTLDFLKKDPNNPILNDTKRRLFRRLGEFIESESLTADAFDALAAKNGLTRVEFARAIMEESSRAGKELNQLSQIAKRIRELHPDDAALDEVIGKGGDFWKWYRKVDNVRRQLLIGQLATAARNIISQGARVGVEMFDDAIFGMMGLMKGDGKKSFAYLMEDFNALVRRLTPSGQARLENMLRRFDGVNEAMLGGNISDVTLTNKALSYINAINRFQEHQFRKVAFDARISALTRKHGLDPLRDDVPDWMIKDAFDHAMELTFQKGNSKLAEAMRNAYRAFPLLTTVNPFPRFWANSVNFLIDFGPLGLGRGVYNLGKKGATDQTMKQISRGITGTMMLGGAWQLRNSEYAGEKYYELKFGDKYIDTRAFAPFSTYLALAEMLKGEKSTMTFGDYMQALVGINRIAGTGLALFDLLKTSVAGGKSGEDTWDLGKRTLADLVAQYIGGYTVPLKTVKDVLAAMVPSQGTLQSTKVDLETGGWKTMLRPTLANVPGGNLVNQIPGMEGTVVPSTSMTREGNIRLENPLTRQLSGISYKTKNPLEKEIDRLAIDNLRSRTGTPEIDRLLMRGVAQAGFAQEGNELVQSEYFRYLNPQERISEIKKLAQGYKDEVRDEVKFNVYDKILANKKSAMDRYRYILRLVEKGRVNKELLDDLMYEHDHGMSPAMLDKIEMTFETKVKDPYGPMAGVNAE